MSRTGTSDSGLPSSLRWMSSADAGLFYLQGCSNIDLNGSHLHVAKQATCLSYSEVGAGSLA